MHVKELPMEWFCGDDVVDWSGTSIYLYKANMAFQFDVLDQAERPKKVLISGAWCVNDVDAVP